MKPGRSNENRILDMVDAIEAIRRHPIASKAQYDSNEVLRFFLLKQIEIVGEAAFKLDADFRDRFQSIPWKQIIGMRHILVHDYFDVDWETLWEVLTREIDPLHESLAAVVEGFKEKP